MTGLTFEKSERLLKRIEFEKVMDAGQKTRVENICTVFRLANGLDCQRLGIIASKKIGKACVRNRVKRRVREAFRRIKADLRPPLDIVVIAGRGLAPLPFAVLERKLAETLRVKPRS